MALSTRVCVDISACDRDRLCSKILHTGTIQLGWEWSLHYWHQLGRHLQGKCHLRLRLNSGLQENQICEFWCRFQWRIHWNKSGGSDLHVAWDMAVWSWCRTFVALGKERVKEGRYYKYDLTLVPKGIKKRQGHWLEFVGLWGYYREGKHLFHKTFYSGWSG